MTMQTKLVDGVEVPLSAEEIQDLTAEKATFKSINDVLIAAETARQLDFAELATAKATAALTVITSDLATVDTDLSSVDTATNVQIRDMVKRILQREKRALNRESAEIKVLMRLIN